MWAGPGAGTPEFVHLCGHVPKHQEGRDLMARVGLVRLSSWLPIRALGCRWLMSVSAYDRPVCALTSSAPPNQPDDCFLLMAHISLLFSSLTAALLAPSPFPVTAFRGLPSPISGQRRLSLVGGSHSGAAGAGLGGGLRSETSHSFPAPPALYPDGLGAQGIRPPPHSLLPSLPACPFCPP